MVLGGPQPTVFCTHLCQNLDEKEEACVLPVIRHWGNILANLTPINKLPSVEVCSDYKTTLRILLNYKDFYTLTMFNFRIFHLPAGSKKKLNNFSTTSKQQGLYLDSKNLCLA